MILLDKIYLSKITPRTHKAEDMQGAILAVIFFVSCYNRGYIPKVFAFKKPYPLNPGKSGLFHFLLIRTKQSKSQKFQRAVSSSS